ncbi:hypothetical protein [Methanobrevibacter sp. DSM 116169]|uniref:hypothetical protein n=1 Tax=Methanobrevibacter sp. DSM 116169 TaxID=3242727 RepID=UPI0038FBFBAE
MIKRSLKICPRCGSTDVDWVIPQIWSMWECKNCSYTGPIIEGDKELSDEIKEDWEYLKKNKD